MTRTADGTVDRREFLEQSAVSAIGLGCFGSLAGLRRALEVAGEQGKPLFTEANVNAFVQSARSGRFAGGTEGLKSSAKTDVRAFVREHFTLSAEQQRKLDALTPQQLAQIHQALDNGLVAGHALQVKVLTPQTRHPGASPAGGGANDLRITVEHKRNLNTPEYRGSGATNDGATVTDSWSLICEC